MVRLARAPFVVEGRDNLPGNCAIIVANHESYIDGLILLSVLPRPVSFVAKAELERQVLARWFLGRIDAEFVERFDVERGTADARRMAAKARERVPLMFFPEGTFTRYPGLLSFHMGAFVTAAENGLPVVPLTIRGTRSVFRARDWFPRRGTIAVIIGEPLTPGGQDWTAAVDLRDRARRQILRHLGEPDLALDRARL